MYVDETAAGTDAVDGEGITAILQSLNERIATFKNTQKNITDISSTLKADKRILQDNVDRVTSQQKNIGVTRWYQYLALVVLILIAVVQGLIIIANLPDEKKVVYTTGVFTVAIVCAIILYIIEVRYFSVSVEGFVNPSASASLGKNQSFEAISSTATIAQQLDAYADTVLTMASEFMDNTSYVSLVLQSYRAYGVADFSMRKELNYFTEKEAELTNNSNALRSTGNIIELESRASFSRTLFFIELLVVLSATALGYVLLMPLPAFQPWVLGIGAFLVFVAMFIYILAITSAVRTDSAKKYWGKPTFRG